VLCLVLMVSLLICLSRIDGPSAGAGVAPYKAAAVSEKNANAVVDVQYRPPKPADEKWLERAEQRAWLEWLGSR
jgi:hypothetical protein